MLEAYTKASVVDLFCGIGGLSHGFKLEGFSIACGIDVDEDCRYAFEENNESSFVTRDISELTGDELNDKFAKDSIRILIGCAPCQPFSKYNQKKEDQRWSLVSKFGQLISETQPEIISMENVPRLKDFRDGIVFNQFINTLKESGYNHIWFDNVFCPDYGIPQSRTRLVLMASKFNPIELEPPSYQEENYPTVQDAIGSQPSLQAGEIDDKDSLHRSIDLTSINLQRIQASKSGGTWRDWPSDLVTPCHRKKTGKTYSSVYGRMRWDRPSPTITTQFYGYGNGRFGHPEQDRGLSLREGAILQSFPEGYKFVEKETDICFSTIGRMVGNAVPVKLAQVIARSIRKHLEIYA